MRNSADSVTLLDRVAAQPYAFDFFYALRHVEATQQWQPRLGEAARPVDEPVRLGQEPRLDFAPAAISGVQDAKEFRPPVVQMRFFGLLGPNGALPLHLTEYARDRLLHHGDATFARFLDVFNHRFGLLFYRAWSQAQPVTSLDRPRDDRFAGYVGSLFGLGFKAARNRDAAEDEIKLHHAGSLARQTRNADGLRALLSHYFRLPIRVEEFVARWMSLPLADRTQLGGRSAANQLGRGAVLGAAVWDAQSSIRLHIRCRSLVEYENFLPGGAAAARLVALLRTYLSWEIHWDARLALAAQAVPSTTLGKQGRLGWTTWLGAGARDHDARDLILDYERVDSR